MSTKKSIIACKVLRKRLDDIVTTLQGRPILLASLLQSDKVLSEPQLAAIRCQRGAGAQRVRDSLKVVLNAVETDGSVYDKFISYLKSDESLGHLVNLLQETYGKSV